VISRANDEIRAERVPATHKLENFFVSWGEVNIRKVEDLKGLSTRWKNFQLDITNAKSHRREKIPPCH
jgi:hypothetical protein